MIGKEICVGCHRFHPLYVDIQDADLAFQRKIKFLPKKQIFTGIKNIVNRCCCCSIHIA